MLKRILFPQCKSACPRVSAHRQAFFSPDQVEPSGSLFLPVASPSESGCGQEMWDAARSGGPSLIMVGTNLS
jgi:hypothetical protein